MELMPRQREAIKGAHAWLHIFDGSVRAGKTYASLIRWLEFIGESPVGDLLMVGKTERTLRDNVISVLERWVDCRHIAGAGLLEVCGRRIYVRGANDERSEMKIRGLGLVGAYCDELTTWPESYWLMLLSRLSEPGAKLFATTNPDYPSHWLKADYLDKAGEIDLYRARFRLDDNTELPAEFIHNITQSYTGLWRKRYIDGEWIAAEGAVYGDVWNPDVHIVATLPEMRRVWAAVDYGTGNPFVELVIGLGSDDRLYVIAEWRWDGRGPRGQLAASQYRQKLEAWHLKLGRAPQWVYVDPEEAGFRIELRQNGWKGVAQADNSVVEGIRLVTDLLAKDKLRVHESCVGLIDEFPGYVWDPDATEDKPIKADDHSLDALRYGILSSELFWRRQVLGSLRRVA